MFVSCVVNAIQIVLTAGIASSMLIAKGFFNEDDMTLFKRQRASYIDPLSQYRSSM